MADLITLEEFKDYLGQGAKKSPAQEDLMKACVAAASNMVRDALSLDVDQRSYDEIYDGNGRPFLPLRNVPVAPSPLPVVTENGAALTVTAGYDVTADVAVDFERGYLKRQLGPTVISGQRSFFPGSWTRGFQNVRAVYTAGFSPIPEEFKMLTRYLASRYFVEPDERRIGKSRVGQGSHSTEFIEGLPEMYKEIIRINRRTYLAR